MIDRLLVTGFEPWGEHRVNSSALAIEPLDGIEIEGIKLKAAILPVHFDHSVTALLDAAEAFQPDAIVCFGMLSHGPAVWRVELVAHNLDGRLPEEVPLEGEAPRILPTGLPAARILGRLLDAGLPAELSESAGRFVCNHLFFHALRAAEAGALPEVTGFIHVPPPLLREDDAPGTTASKASPVPRGSGPVNLDPLHEGARLVAEAVLSQPGDRAGMRV